MYIHNALIAKNSKTLNALINGGMSETADGYATLEDVEVGTFVRFTQWLYTGNYDARSPSLSRSDSIPVHHSLRHKAMGIVEVDQVSVWAHHAWHSSAGLKRKPNVSRSGQQFYAADASRRQNLWATFTGGSSASMPARLDYCATPSSHHAEGIDNLYLTHAQLYVFADKYGVFGLQQIAIDNLKQNLIEFTDMSQERIEAINDLILYTMENTASLEGDKVDKLRDLVIQYAVICFEILFEDEEFRALFATNAEFMFELTRRLMARLD